jgi:hypothetical protein
MATARPTGPAPAVATVATPVSLVTYNHMRFLITDSVSTALVAPGWSDCPGKRIDRSSFPKLNEYACCVTGAAVYRCSSAAH